MKAAIVRKNPRRNFWIKLTAWEYWPFGIIQFPLFIYWFWLSLRSRSLLFFSASNPGIPMGGMFGESKSKILDGISAEYIPKTILITLPTSVKGVRERLDAEGMKLPVVFKPDLGERGFMVRRIYTDDEIARYIAEIKIDFIVQELVDLPLEFGVLYERRPSAKRGRVTSIVAKEMLAVVGDGTSTLRELILTKDRAKLQWEKLKIRFSNQLDTILPEGQVLELVSIGNHAQGTKFLNGNYLIDDRLTESFDRIASKIPGFYFGRFDLRCSSVEDLKDGKVKILELNGCGAEPAHIYDPDFRLLDAIIVLFRHWRSIFEIARENHKLGVPYVSLKEGLAYYKKFKAATSGS